jgi:hypothetical protein
MGAAGRSDRPRSVPASDSYADVGIWMLRGIPLDVDMQGKEVTRVARRDATLYLRTPSGLASIHHSLF